MPGQQCPEILHLFSTVHKSTPQGMLAATEDCPTSCFKIDFYLLENLKAPAVQNLQHSCTRDALDELPTMHHTSEHMILVSLPCFYHQWMQLGWFGDAFISHPKLAPCTHLLKEEVLSQVTGHSKLNIDRCSFLWEKKKASNTEKLCWSFEFSHQNSTPLQHLQGEQTPYRKESLVKKEAKQGVLSTALDSPSLSPQPSLLPPQPPLTLRRPCPVAPLEQVKPHLPTAVCVRAHEAHTVFAASQHHKWLF